MLQSLLSDTMLRALLFPNRVVFNVATPWSRALILLDLKVSVPQPKAIYFEWSVRGLELAARRLFLAPRPDSVSRSVSTFRAIFIYKVISERISGFNYSDRLMTQWKFGVIGAVPFPVAISSFGQPRVERMLTYTLSSPLHTMWYPSSEYILWFS